MKKLLLIITITVCANAQQLVNSFSVTSNTAQVPTPYVANPVGLYSNPIFAVSNGGLYDIYDGMLGKIASVPAIKQSAYSSISYLLNVNSGWLLLCINTDTSGYGITRNYKYQSNLYNGSSLIWTDSSYVVPLFTGGYCYLFTSLSAYALAGTFTYKIWKLGKAPASISPLSKQITMSERSEALMIPNGLKIIAHGNSDGTTMIQLFDLAGRITYSGLILNDKPAIIPSNMLPNSPFVTNIGGSIGSLYRKVK